MDKPLHIYFRLVHTKKKVNLGFLSNRVAWLHPITGKTQMQFYHDSLRDSNKYRNTLLMNEWRKQRHKGWTLTWNNVYRLGVLKNSDEELRQHDYIFSSHTSLPTLVNMICGEFLEGGEGWRMCSLQTGWTTKGIHLALWDSKRSIIRRN